MEEKCCSQPSDPTHASQSLASLNGIGDSLLQECIHGCPPCDGKVAPNELGDKVRDLLAQRVNRCEGEGSKSEGSRQLRQWKRSR